MGRRLMKFFFFVVPKIEMRTRGEIFIMFCVLADIYCYWTLTFEE